MKIFTSPHLYHSSFLMPGPAGGRERGSALLAVFWLIAVLVLAVFSTSWVVQADSETVVSEKKAFRAMQLAEMGVAVAANPAVQEFDPLLIGQINEDEGYQARIRSESGWFDINLALQSMTEGDLEGQTALEDLFTFWGLDLQSEAQFVINALRDWIDADEIPSGISPDMGGAEAGWYEEQGQLNYPFNRPFFDIEEMALCRGMDIVEQYQPNWREFFTVFSRQKVNLNEAEPALIAALARLDYVEDVDELVETRNGADGVPDTEDDYQFQSVEEALALLKGVGDIEEIADRFDVRGSTVRIESTGIVGDYRRRLILVISNRESRPVILHREETPIVP